MKIFKSKKRFVLCLVVPLVVIVVTVIMLNREPENIYEQGIIDANNKKETIEPLLEKKASYETLYEINFDDSNDTWGFSAPNMSMTIDAEPLSGNGGNKLKLEQINQSGARAATKNFAEAISGLKMFFNFDWYPGNINSKGSNLNDNGGEIVFYDSNNNRVLTVKHIKNSPLTAYAGSNETEAVTSKFKDPLKWYNVGIIIELSLATAIINISDGDDTESLEISLSGVSFDGTVKQMQVGGIRTSGNNITWTTYLDNISVYNVPSSPKAIVTVEKKAYVTVYAGENINISDIGLPQEVSVTLSDGTNTTAEIAEWRPLETEWDTSAAGVYIFKGIIKESEQVKNDLGKSAVVYVNNRLRISADYAYRIEWLDRGVCALKADEGIFISWRLKIYEYDMDITFNIYRNGVKINETPLRLTNYTDKGGKPNDVYEIETIINNVPEARESCRAQSEDYLSIPMQKPENRKTRDGREYAYILNDAGVGDFDGDGEYEIVVKWYPTNAIDSAKVGYTGPTIFDAYKLDGTLLWRIDMGANLTSGAHYNQFLIYDFDGDGKSEFFIKTADGTTVYGVTNGKADYNKVLGIVGDPSANGAYSAIRGAIGHITGGPEYVTMFRGNTGEIIDTAEYRFSIEKTGVSTWGDGNYNRSDRFLAGVAFLGSGNPSAVQARGYYERTTLVAYDLINGKLVERCYYDSAENNGIGIGMGNHQLSAADVDNDGFDEIIYGSVAFDNDLTVMHVNDGNMQREKGSHGDAMHVGAFEPDSEELQFFGVREVASVASMALNNAATGETRWAYFASKDTGRGLAANITSNPGYEFWGTGNTLPEEGGGVYNINGDIVFNSFRNIGLSVNFALYWDGDLLHELLDSAEGQPMNITKLNEATGRLDTLKTLSGTKSNNGTKANPSLQADIIGDWREEVLVPVMDDNELRIYSTVIPTEYRVYTLMHDHIYRLGVAWQNVGYNQPPHIGFYLGEDIRGEVLAGGLKIQNIYMVN